MWCILWALLTDWKTLGSEETETCVAETDMCAFQKWGGDTRGSANSPSPNHSTCGKQIKYSTLGARNTLLQMATLSKKVSADRTWHNDGGTWRGAERNIIYPLNLTWNIKNGNPRIVYQHYHKVVKLPSCLLVYKTPLPIVRFVYVHIFPMVFMSINPTICWSCKAT